MLKRMNSLFREIIEILNRIMNQVIRPILATIALILFLFALSLTSHAQTAVQDKSLKSYKMPPNLKKHYIEKYKKDNDRIDSVTSDLRETPHGPRGHLSLRGQINPTNVESGSGDTAGRARRLAKAFLKDEADLLGLPDLDELREEKIITDMGYDGEYSIIRYRRYIGDLPIDLAEVLIQVGPGDSITYVQAFLVPASPELYQAVATKTIEKSDVLKIVERDLRAHGFTLEDVKIGDIDRIALSTAPYVVWRVNIGLINLNKKHETPSWSYQIDAFTGRIIHKADTRIRN